MNRPQQHNNKRSNQRRRSQQRPPKPVDVWRTPPELPELEPVRIADEVSALQRSLGDPPMLAGSAITGHYFSAVVEHAAALAGALALSADVLARSGDD